MRGDTPDISDETLLGYLLGGLANAEHAMVESALAACPSLRQRLDDLRGLLEPMAAAQDVFEPRADLVAETMARIGEQESCCNTAPQLSSPVGAEWSETPVSTRVAWLDSLVTLAAGILFLSFLLPTVWHWRESARQLSCSENLRNIGAAFQLFARVRGDSSLPAIDTVGPLTFAGTYAIRLQDYQLLEDSRWVLCPSIRHLTYPASIPSSAQFLAASPDEQRLWRYVSGGNYAYHLGSRIAKDYATLTLDAPVRFAMLGDMWPSRFGAVNEAQGPVRLHGERAANVLYNDGSVHLIRIPEGTEEVILDNPFLNLESRQGVGIGLQDACLGPSSWLPAIDLHLPRP